MGHPSGGGPTLWCRSQKVAVRKGLTGVETGYRGVYSRGMNNDADGMTRVNLIWTIEGAKRTRSGKLYELHYQERANAEASVRRLARKGDTVTFTTF